MILKIQDLTKSYFSHKVLNKISFAFESGINYLLAPNGAGKSTLLRLIAGIEPKDSGTIKFNGETRKFSDYGSYVPDKMSMYPFVTGQEFLELVSHAKEGSTKLPATLNMVNDLKVSQYLFTPFSKMSIGTQKKYFIIAGLIGDFSCLLLDEPSNAVDGDSMEIIINYLKKISKNKLVLIATHDRDLQSKLPGRMFNL